MAQCPLCQASIEEDFGLVDCPGCGAALFVEIDGQVRTSQSDSQMESPVDPEPQVVAHADFEDEESFESLEQNLIDEIQSEAFEGDPESDSEDDQEVDSGQEPESFPVEEEQASDALAESPLLAEDPTDEQVPPPEMFDEMEAANSEVPSSQIEESGDLSDLASFANSDVSQGREGLLRFNVKVRGIDSAEIRRELEEILDDPRFVWDSIKIKKSIYRGELNLKDLTSVKAFIFIQRARELPLELMWEQYAVHQSS